MSAHETTGLYGIGVNEDHRHGHVKFAIKRVKEARNCKIYKCVVSLAVRVICESAYLS